MTFKGLAWPLFELEGLPVTPFRLLAYPRSRAVRSTEPFRASLLFREIPTSGPSPPSGALPAVLPALPRLAAISGGCHTPWLLTPWS